LDWLMKISVPSSYSAREPAKLRSSAEPVPELIPQPEVPPPLGLLSAAWWQSFLNGNADALLARVDAQGALDLIAAKLGREVSQLDANGSIRSCEFRRRIYAEFGADLALHTMQGLWMEASANGDQPKAPTEIEMPETVAKFFEREESPYIPAHRRESDQARLEREGRASFGGWCG
jgi:hypothetical protein